MPKAKQGRPSGATCVAGVVQVFIDAAGAAGVSRSRALQAIGIKTLPGDPWAHMPFEVLIRACGELTALTHDPDFALHAAEFTQFGILDVFDYALQTVSSVADTLERGRRFGRLLQNAADLELERRGGNLIIRHRSLEGAPLLPPALAEFHLAATLVRARVAAGRWFPIHAVRFAHGLTRNPHEVRRIFGVQPTWNALVDEYELTREVVDLPLKHSDPRLSSLLDRLAQSLLDAVPHAPTLRNRVRRLIIEQLPEGARLEAIAREMHMSPRTLERRLESDIGERFEELREEVRRELAFRALVEATKVQEVAFRLGYQSPRAFERTFRKWTGTTPGRWRRAHKQQPSGAEQGVPGRALGRRGAK